MIWRFAILALVLLAGTSCAHRGLRLTGSSTGDSALYLVGDAAVVEDGAVSDTNLVSLDPERVWGGVGFGTYGRADQTGHMIVLGGKALVKSVDHAAGYPVDFWKGPVRTPFCAWVRRGVAPQARYHMEDLGSKSLQELAAQLCEGRGKHFLIIGSGRFKNLVYSSLKEAPVGGTPLTGSNAGHFFHGRETRAGARAVFVALVENPGDVEGPLRRGMRERVFREEPESDEASSSLILARFATLRGGSLPDPEELPQEAAEYSDVGELFPESVLGGGTFLVFNLGSLNPR